MTPETGTGNEFTAKRVAFVGRLGGVNRREAHRLIRQQGGIAVDRIEDGVDVVVIGGEELPLGDERLLDEALRDQAARGQVEVIRETELWNRLGLVETEQHIRRLYTPAMLAQLLKVPVAIIRRWHRRGLIVPAREVHRLPYFDFREVATARRLAELLAAGATPAAIERKLEQLARLVPDVDRPLAQLSVIAEGRELLLRQGEGLIEAGGQMRLDFDAAERSKAPPDAVAEEVIPDAVSASQLLSQTKPPPTTEQLLTVAADLEDAGQTADAIELYRAAAMAGGPNADLCFRLAELLYLTGDVTAARDRYMMAVELDEQFVEARANLGCVLIELGEMELALAAFQGALASHPDYPDAHYHLARTLDDSGRHSEAERHWREFLCLAPDSPWADEARARLQPS
jgi:tetratricopeptide (TPR) repeat protein